jgi:hypothetical protein
MYDSGNAKNFHSSSEINSIRKEFKHTITIKKKDLNAVMLKTQKTLKKMNTKS